MGALIKVNKYLWAVSGKLLVGGFCSVSGCSGFFFLSELERQRSSEWL